MNPHPPIFDFDPEPVALIEPSRVIQPRDVPEHCVICFFHEVIDHVVQEHAARVAVKNRWEDGPHPLYEIDHHGRRLAFFHPGVGAPLGAGLLEEVFAYGCRKFIVCGGCGVLAKDMAVGHLTVLQAALRDEGVSYHYLPPGREVAAHPLAVAALEQTLAKRGLPYVSGDEWDHRGWQSRRDVRHSLFWLAAEACLML